MSLFDRRPRLRWAVPAVAGAFIAAGTLASSASADGGLPPVTAQELLVALQTRTPVPMSGTVVVTSDLGLPELPSASRATEPSDLMMGTHTVRVWSDGPARTRLAIIESAQEYDIIRNGADVWTWTSNGSVAEHYVLGQPDGDRKPTDMPRTPQEAADLVLSALAPSTEVTTSGAATVAGRPVYDLVLTPTQPGTTVSRAVISLDAQTSAPLRVQILSTQMSEPAIDVAFRTVDFSAPDPSLFEFTPAEGMKVTDHGAMKPEGSTAEKPVAKPTVVGTGWTRVMIATVPPDMAAKAAESDAASQVAALVSSLPVTTGPWGSGRVFEGTLFSAILTDDGRLAAGAVTPELLAEALAAG